MSLTKKEIEEYRVRLEVLYKELTGFMRKSNADVTKPDERSRCRAEIPPVRV